MKVKIGTKIMASYLIILTITLVIAALTAGFVVRFMIKRTENSELVEQGISIANIIEERLEDKGIQKVVGFMQNIEIASLTKADMYILNTQGEIVYTSASEDDERVIKRIIGSNRVNYTFSRTAIRNSSNEVIGHIVLITNIAYIRTINRNIIISMILAFLIGSGIAIIIAYIIQRNITRPLKQLRDEAITYDGESGFQLTEISTGDEIEELSIVFQKMLSRIDENIVERRRVFQNTSHELKSPLMSIQGYAEAIKDGIVEGEEIDESLDIIITKTIELKDTIDEVLYISKIENSEISVDLKSMDIYDYIKLWYHSSEIMVMKRDIKLELIGENLKGINVLLDEEKFSNVLNNLLENALRYANKEIYLEIVKRDREIVIRMIDDGQGLKDGEDQLVFERFYKGKGGKSGLGLAITKLIVEEHGGQIITYNDSRLGAVFEIKLPFDNSYH